MSDPNNSQEEIKSSDVPTCSLPRFRQRSTYSTTTLEILHATFAQNGYPSRSERSHLSDLTGESETRIASWFKYHRAQARKRNETVPNPHCVPQSSSRRVAKAKVFHTSTDLSTNDATTELHTALSTCQNVQQNHHIPSQIIPDDFDSVASAVSKRQMKNVQPKHSEFSWPSFSTQDMSNSFIPNHMTGLSSEPTIPNRWSSGISSSVSPTLFDASNLHDPTRYRTQTTNPFVSWGSYLSQPVYPFSYQYQNPAYVLPYAPCAFPHLPANAPSTLYSQSHPPAVNNASSVIQIPDANNNSYHIIQARNPLQQAAPINLTMGSVDHVIHQTTPEVNLTANTDTISTTSSCEKSVSDIFLSSPFSETSQSTSSDFVSGDNSHSPSPKIMDSSKPEVTNSKDCSVNTPPLLHDVFHKSISPISDSDLNDVRPRISSLDSPEITYATLHTSRYIPSVEDFQQFIATNKSSSTDAGSRDEFVW